MTPKEKAIELYDKYVGTEGRLHIQLKLTGFTEVKRKAKKHSLIAVEELIDSHLLLTTTHDSKPSIRCKRYWQEVKKEIELL
jgi:hypothetical protein